MGSDEEVLVDLDDDVLEVAGQNLVLGGVHGRHQAPGAAFDQAGVGVAGDEASGHGQVIGA